ncbi:alkaline phosphatase D family protein [Mesoflavibacter zeaxanthinifaciens]|uniref:alkaline phosphatase D family protein n=1 Tax=Mesoflavibacter zeaxanthinifaciens TaxID=393060 RepID=UPI003A90FBE8
MKFYVIFIVFSIFSTAKIIAQQTDEKKCFETIEKNADCFEHKITNCSTKFPKYDEAPDYKVRQYQAKIAFPITEESSRIWVKGSDSLNKVGIYDENNILVSKIHVLEKPFYTAIIDVEESYQSVIVKYANENYELINSKDTCKVFPKNLEFFTKKEDVFSMVFYGCFQPFYVNESNRKSDIIHDKNKPLNFLMRELFKDISNQKPLTYVPYKENKTNGILIQNPKILVATGDQVYTDAGYGYKTLLNHPLSAWAHTCNDPYPLLGHDDYSTHLNRCYQHFNSFECFNSVFSKLPSINVWDDHEIRDGWGSHGDEYNSDGTMNAFLKPYFELSRDAFLEHQFKLGPESRNISNINTALDQKFMVNGKAVFMFDLRTNRNICEGIVIDNDQMKRFIEWCKMVENDQEVIIISSIPFFYEQNGFAAKMAESLDQGELKDDLRDSWNYSVNKPQRDSIIEELIKLRTRNVKPIIVSGDVHIGGIISTWYKNKVTNKNERLCYEFIYSGLSHEKLGEARKSTSSHIIKRSEKVRVVDPTFKVGKDSVEIYPIYEFTRAKLNFGALQFDKDNLTVASLFTIGDKEKRLIRRRLKLDWKESFDDYMNRTTFPSHWYLIPWKWKAFRPPIVPYDIIYLDEYKRLKINEYGK